MSKKHFIAIAAEINEQAERYRNRRDSTDSTAEPWQSYHLEAQGALEALYDTALRLSKVFAGFNGNFDRQRFLTACGF